MILNSSYLTNCNFFPTAAIAYWMGYNLYFYDNGGKELFIIQGASCQALGKQITSSLNRVCMFCLSWFLSVCNSTLLQTESNLIQSCDCALGLYIVSFQPFRLYLRTLKAFPDNGFKKTCFLSLVVILSQSLNGIQSPYSVYVESRYWKKKPTF